MAQLKARLVPLESNEKLAFQALEAALDCLT